MRDATLFSIKNHSQRRAVFDASARIQVFEFSVNIRERGPAETREVQQRSVTNKLNNVLSRTRRH